MSKLQSDLFEELRRDEGKVVKEMSFFDDKNVEPIEDSQRFSPHYQMIKDTIEQVQTEKAKLNKCPKMLMGDDIDRFEGLLRKIQ